MCTKFMSLQNQVLFFKNLLKYFERDFAMAVCVHNIIKTRTSE